MPSGTATLGFRRESDLAAPVARFLRNRAFHSQGEEVPFYEYRIDVYAYSSRANLTVAVELKLTKWARAVEQALLYQLCSELVYIALPSEYVKRVNLEVLRRHGIGLIAVERDRCREVLAPVTSDVTRLHYRSELVAMLSGDDAHVR